MRDGVFEYAAHHGYPARIAKQIISTMIASAQDGFADEHPELREFVLDRNRRLAESELRLAMYLCPTHTGRSTGEAFAQKAGGNPHVLVEFALQPFGYVLTLSGEPLDPRPVSISWLADCDYDELKPISLPSIPVLPTHEALPGDYRTKDEIRRDVIINILNEQGHPSSVDEAERILSAGGGPAFFEEHGEEWDWSPTRGLT